MIRRAETTEKILITGEPLEIPESLGISLESARVYTNLRKRHTDGVFGRIETSIRLTKFSDDPDFSREVALHECVFHCLSRFSSKSRSAESNEVRAPRIIPLIESGQQVLTVENSQKITFVQFEKILGQVLTSEQFVNHIMVLLQAFSEIKKGELSGVLEEKGKPEYLRDVELWFAEVNQLLVNIETRIVEPGISSLFSNLKEKLATIELKVIALFSGESFEYDLAQGFCHSDLGRHNYICRKDSIYVFDFEKSVWGSRWEDYARVYDDLSKHYGGLHGRKLGSPGYLFWSQLSDHEKVHTQLFVAYKSLLLLKKHLEKLVEEMERYSAREVFPRVGRVLRSFNSLFSALEYLERSY